MVDILLRARQGPIQTTPLYRGFRAPGDTMNQGPSSDDIGLAILEYYSLNSWRVDISTKSSASGSFLSIICDCTAKV